MVIDLLPGLAVRGEVFDDLLAEAIDGTGAQDLRSAVSVAPRGAILAANSGDAIFGIPLKPEYQTEDYARAVMSVGRPKRSADDTERAVALRMTRQEILELRDDLPPDQEQSPRYWAIIDESALYRAVGSPEIMRAQRDSLVEMAQRPNITIQIVLNEKGPTSAYGRAFAILVSHKNSVVYLEDPNSAHYVRRGMR